MRFFHRCAGRVLEVPFFRLVSKISAVVGEQNPTPCFDRLVYLVVGYAVPLENLFLFLLSMFCPRSPASFQSLRSVVARLPLFALLGFFGPFFPRLPLGI